MCRECFPGPATQPAPPLPHVRGFPALRVLPAGPTSTVAFIFLRICPFGRHTRPATTSQDAGGSPSCLDTSISAHAVLLDPAGVSSDHRPCGRLPWPSRYLTLSALRMCHEAQSLHLRYGLGLALSTLSPCCCLHEPKTRFLVEWLVLLARDGNFTRWKRPAYPGAPKNFSKSRSTTQPYPSAMYCCASCTACRALRPGRKP
jgi:hypothetical protein